MKLKCKNGCEDPGWFNVISPIGIAVKPDGYFIEQHLIDLYLTNEELKEVLLCGNCEGPVSVTGD
jgi:hypothetical protein